jgi:hypothetical protein
MSGLAASAGADELRRVLNAAGSLAADFVECLPHREQISRSRQSSSDGSGSPDTRMTGTR